MIRLLTALALSCSLLAACATPGVSAVEVELSEFAIDTSAEGFIPGSVDLAVTNEGEFAHTLVVETVDGGLLTATEIIEPGTTIELDLELEAKVYRFTCRIVATSEDGAVFDHFERGMVATLRPAG